MMNYCQAPSSERYPLYHAVNSWLLNVFKQIILTQDMKARIKK